MEQELPDLKKEVSEIKARNLKVEKDKAWETSGFRKIAVAILTYLTMVLVMWSLNNESPFTSSIIPTLGFLLSTSSLPLLRKVWERS